MGKDEDFFRDSQKLPSKIKTEIVRKYLWAWATLMSNPERNYTRKIGYVDLFAGAGHFQNKDGANQPSTPIEIMDICLREDKFAKSLYLHFNEANEKNFISLNEALQGHPAWGLMRKRTSTTCDKITASNLDKYIKDYPSLYFLDPYGYRGYSISAIAEIMKGYGNDVLLFFNYNRFNMDISHDLEKIRYQSTIFLGKKSKDHLMKKLDEDSGGNRKGIITDHIWSEIETCVPQGCYVIPFEFEFLDKERTSHYLVLVTKSPLGRKIGKDVMAGMRTEREAGDFRFSLKKSKRGASLFSNYFFLGELLVERFKGETLTVQEIFRKYEDENPRSPYVEKDYKDTLKQLRHHGVIKVFKAENKSVPDHQMPDRAFVKFLTDL